MQNKKKLSIIVGSFLVVLLLAFSAPRLAHAGFLDNVQNFLKNVFTKQIEVGKQLNGKDVVGKITPLYKPALDYEQAVIDAVQNASPSVVSIVVSKNVPILENCAVDPFANLPPELKGMFGNGIQFSQPCESATQKEKKDVGGGSGFIVSDDGMILTNKHVVYDKNAEYTVFTNDGKKYPAKVLARDSVNDIALIKITATGLRSATLGDSDSIKLGQTAIVIGNSLGEFRNTVSTGVISGLSRNVTAGGAEFGNETIQGVIQTDAAINLGNSGGPLLNLRGEVIGMNTAMASGAQNIGFAIPINQAKRAIESVKKTGSIKSPFIGVRYILIDEELAKKEKLSVTEGALVRGSKDGPAVAKNSPAGKAGVQAEDIIVSLNGENVTQEKSLSQLLQKYGVGDTVALKIVRGDKTLDISVVLSERPENAK